MSKKNASALNKSIVFIVFHTDFSCKKSQLHALCFIPGKRRTIVPIVKYSMSVLLLAEPFAFTWTLSLWHCINFWCLKCGWILKKVAFYKKDTFFYCNVASKTVCKVKWSTMKWIFLKIIAFHWEIMMQHFSLQKTE